MFLGKEAVPRHEGGARRYITSDVMTTTASAMAASANTEKKTIVPITIN